MGKICRVSCWRFAVIAILGLIGGCQAYDDNIEASPVAKNAAIDYLESLPVGTKVYVWPNRMRAYKTVGDDRAVRASVDRYLGLRRNAFPLATRLAQISVIPVGAEESVASALEVSGLLPSYREFLRTAPQSNDGCTAYLFTSRDTWASAGVVLVRQDMFNDAVALDGCVHVALDYINGVPSAGTEFSSSAFPDVEARGAILAASRQCSTEGTGPRNAQERTRDNLTPLPSIDCITEKLRGEPK